MSSATLATGTPDTTVRRVIAVSAFPVVMTAAVVVAHYAYINGHAAAASLGVIVGSGVYKETVEWAMKHLNAGIAERQAGLGEMDIIFGAVVSVDRDARAAREKVRPRVANRAHHNFRMTLDSVPEEFRPEIQNLLDNFA